MSWVSSAAPAALTTQPSSSSTAPHHHPAAPRAVVPPAVLALKSQSFLRARERDRCPRTLAPLQTRPVLKAVDYLETLPAQRHVDQLRHVLLQWRAADAVVNSHAQRSQLRQVAAELGIPLPRGVLNDCSKVSHTIAEFFTARVSALRTFVVSSAAAMSGDIAATAAVAAQAAARGSGAGDSGVGSYAVVGSSVPKGKK